MLSVSYYFLKKGKGNAELGDVNFSICLHEGKQLYDQDWYSLKGAQNADHFGFSRGCAWYGVGCGFLLVLLVSHLRPSQRRNDPVVG